MYPFLARIFRDFKHHTP